MEILHNSQGGEARNHCVLLFGLGMIGSAIRNSLLLLGYQRHKQIDINWSNTDTLKNNLASIDATLADLPETDALSVVWSAGKARFNTATPLIEQEQAIFTNAIDALLLESKAINTRSYRFHLISSAGGLFEGQKVITTLSKARPQRAYGHYKLEQETTLLSALGNKNVFIYRPSSVFGPAGNTKTPGLINTLIANNLNVDSITSLDANVMALRDYVFSEDIGRYIARQITTDSSNAHRPEYFFLVSGRSASIFEVSRRIESSLHTKLRVRYDQNYGNSADMTFSPSVMPPNWHPTDLQTGIRLALIASLNVTTGNHAN